MTIVPAAAAGRRLRMGRPYATLFVYDPQRLPASRAEILRRQFGLTISEARLADLIASGFTLATAAERLRVTIGTVRNQLEQIFQKTDTHRQSDLVRLLMRLPAYTVERLP